MHSYLLSALIIVHLTVSSVRGQNLPICVIGSGISGLSIATLLQRKGYDVVVFEKESRIGGKIETFRLSDKIQVDMCPFFFGSWQKSLLRYVKQYNLPYALFDDTDKVGYDPSSGYFKVIPPRTPAQIAELEEAVLRYITYRSEYERDLQVGYVNANPELFVSILEWLTDRNLEILRPIFLLMMTVEGYGALDEIAALYALQLVSKPLILKLTTAQLRHGAFYILTNGMEQLTEKMAGDLNVSRNMELTQIVREADHQTLYFNRKCKPQLKCNKTILAFPPLLNDVSKIAKLNANESEILRQVRIHRYSSSANYIPTLDHNFYFEAYKLPNMELVAPSGTGEVVALLKQSSKNMTNMYSSYSWIRGSYDSPLTNSELLSIDMQLQSFLRNISKDSKTYHKKDSKYFPHVENHFLELGFYNKFDTIQGEGGMFYATTLLTFEILECAIRMTENLVQRFF